MYSKLKIYRTGKCKITKMVEFRSLSFIVLVLFLACFERIQGHGMMLEPVGRASRWRYNSSAPKDYDDNGLFCGGFNKQWNVNKGKCGLCGDDYALNTPRSHEIGGKYGEGVIVRSYKIGNVIPIGVKLTANHKGYFYFNLCNLDKSKENEECYQKYNLQLIDGKYKFYVNSNNPGWFNTTLQLPKDVVCKHCVLRWTYYAGNSWGICPNGTGAVGCGPQENFRSCADIKITSGSIQTQIFTGSEEDNASERDEELEENYSHNFHNVRINKPRPPVLEVDRKVFSTKGEILEEIKKLFSLILNEKQYSEIDEAIAKLGISDDYVS